MGFFRKRENNNSNNDKELDITNHKLAQIIADDCYFDKTYVFYCNDEQHLGRLETAIKNICDCRGFSYERKIYPDTCIFYVYVKKMEEPKYNVGDVIQISENITSMVLSRERGHNDWFYTIAGMDDSISERRLNMEKITKIK